MRVNKIESSVIKKIEECKVFFMNIFYKEYTIRTDRTEYYVKIVSLDDFLFHHKINLDSTILKKAISDIEMMLGKIEFFGMYNITLECCDLDQIYKWKVWYDDLLKVTGENK